MILNHSSNGISRIFEWFNIDSSFNMSNCKGHSEYLKHNNNSLHINYQWLLQENLNTKKLRALRNKYLSQFNSTLKN